MISNKVFVLALLVSLTLSNQIHPLHDEVMQFISTQPTKTQFKLWHYVFNKPYDLNSEEGLSKYKTFKKNLQYIKSENEKNQGFTLGLGPFTDLSFEEFSKTYLTLKPESLVFSEEEKRELGWFDDMVDAEEGLNESKPQATLRKKGENNDHVSKDWTYLYPTVKNQNPCGSCWAFGAIGALEGQTYQMGHKIVLSEQQLIDCSVLNSGCDGGTGNNAVKYIREYGVMQEKDYPYTGRDEQCKYKENKVKVKSSYRICSPDGWLCDDERLIEHLKNGPYASSLLAGQAMQHYKQGDIAPELCDTINHAVVVVQIDFRTKRIKIRNSWGAWWGEKGYGYINANQHRGLRGCGLLEYSVQPKDVQVLDG